MPNENKRNVVAKNNKQARKQKASTTKQEKLENNIFQIEKTKPDKLNAKNILKEKSNDKNNEIKKIKKDISKISNDQKKLMANPERAKLLEQKEIMKLEIIESKIKREKLLTDLDQKIAEAKLKEKKLKTLLNKQAEEEKIILESDRERDRQEIEFQKELIIKKKQELRKNKKSLRKQSEFFSITANNSKLSLKKNSKEKLISAKSMREKEMSEYRKRINEIKLKNKELKSKIKEEAINQMHDAKKRQMENALRIKEEKQQIIAVKEKLKNTRRQQKALAVAKRLKKIKSQKESINALKLKENEIKTKYKTKALKLESKITNDKIISAKKINSMIDNNNNDINKINEEIKATKIHSINNLAIKRGAFNNKLDESKEKMNETNVKYSSDRSVLANKFVSAFDDTIVFYNSNTDLISGLIIESFGKEGSRRFAKAQLPAIEQDIDKYKKHPKIYNMIEKFRELKGFAIRLESLAGYINILLEKDFSKKEMSKFHFHSIAALLTNHSIKFANGYIEPIVNGKTVDYIFSRKVINVNKLVESKNPDVQKSINILITQKIIDGGSILLAKGLLATKVGDNIEILQDTNFLKAHR